MKHEHVLELKKKSSDWIESASILQVLVTVHAVITSDARTVPYPYSF